MEYNYELDKKFKQLMSERKLRYVKLLKQGSYSGTRYESEDEIWDVYENWDWDNHVWYDVKRRK